MFLRSRHLVGALALFGASSLVTLTLPADARAQQPEAPQPGQEQPRKAEPQPEQDQPEQDQPEQEPVKGSGGSRAGETEKKAADTGTVFSLDQLVARAVGNEALVAEFRAKRHKAEADAYKADNITWRPSLRSTTFLAVVPDNADPDEFERNLDQFGALDIGPYIREELDVIMPMYTFGKDDIAQQLAELGLDNNELEFENARLDAIYQTKRAYWGLRLSLAFQEMLDEGDELISEQLDDMQEKRDFGGVDFDIADFRKLEIFSAEVKSRIVDNGKLGSVARAGLHFVADIPDETTIEVTKLDDMDSPPQLKARNYYVGQALANRPELEQLDKGVRARQLEAQLATSGWYPDLFAAFRLRFGWSTKDTAYQRICTASSLEDAVNCDFPEDQAEIDGQPIFAEPYGDPLHAFSLQLGVGLRWNVDPFQQYGDVQKKEAQVQVIQAQRRRARKAVQLEIRKLYQDAADALDKIEINHKRLKAAERWRNQFGLSRQTAGADIEDAVKPLQAYYEARAKYLQAIFDYMVARAALARGVGARGLTDDGDVASE